MNLDVGNLEAPVFRPPSEWDSLLISVTNGCTHRCTFCSMYRTKKFSVRKDILQKSDDDLKRIADAGFTMVYVGIESGDDQVLKDCNKGATQDDYALAARKCHQAGIDWSGIFLLGLAGNDPEKSHRHAVESAKLINRMAPPMPRKWYISPLTLEMTPGSEILAQNLENKFHPCTSTQVLEELYTLIDNTDDDLTDCIFNTNHASNYLSLKGELGKDKKDFLYRIEAGIRDPKVRRPEYMRGL